YRSGNLRGEPRPAVPVALVQPRRTLDRLREQPVTQPARALVVALTEQVAEPDFERRLCVPIRPSDVEELLDDVDGVEECDELGANVALLCLVGARCDLLGEPLYLSRGHGSPFVVVSESSSLRHHLLCFVAYQ